MPKSARKPTPKSALFAAIAVFIAAAPVSAAPPVITNPGWCAQFYPNANCQNYGPGNPYTSYGWTHRRWHRYHHDRHRHD
jgi:hypothetical protein